MFPSLSEGESLIWRKYAVENAQAHAIGMELDREGRRYRGFSNAIVASIRTVKNPDGHGFKLEHLPEEGRLYHAEVGYAPQQGVDFIKIHRTHLKVLLNTLFSKLVPWLR
jgi:hypothetical protein